MNLFFMTPDQVAQMTPQWKGERLDDGRPKVPESILERMRHLTLEEAWMHAARLKWDFQTEAHFQTTHSTDKPLVGRALTLECVPWREDLDLYCKEESRGFGFKGEVGRNDYNKEAVGRLVKDDVMVVDFFDKIKYGTFFGGNLSTAVANRTQGGGAVIWGGIRDIDQVIKIPNLQIYYRGYHPTPIRDYVMTGFNRPVRIGEATCMPGDIVFGSAGGVCFVPAMFAEDAVDAAEKSHVIDIFGFQRLREQKYTASEIDQGPWPKNMWEDFLEWFKHDPEAQKYGYLNWANYPRGGGSV
jgi:regulator of RNase E activity RraA